jgi:hypothetical protein
MTDDFLKKDSGKPCLGFFPADVLAEVCLVMDDGAEKYARHNWTKCPSRMRYIHAGLRHVFAWIGGEDHDRETGRSHLAHAITCLIFALALHQRRLGEDDRPAPCRQEIPAGKRDG